jgi:hypothetical protein
VWFFYALDLKPCVYVVGAYVVGAYVVGAYVVGVYVVGACVELLPLALHSFV